MHTGTLYIISAPSGAGKTSLVKKLTAELENLAVSTSHTTRPQRPGEINKQDYFFIGLDEFKKMLTEQAFLEHAQVFDNYYGTARQTVEDYLENGVDIILEIDWQGAKQVRKTLPECMSIFILPPSTAVLEQRLRNRAQDDDQTIARRMQDAVTEISHYHEYDYLIVNDDFNEALMQLKSIIISKRLNIQRQRDSLATLLASLLGNDQQ